MKEPLYIAIDGGGTGTRVGLYNDTGALLNETVGGPSNPYQSSPEIAAEYLSELAMRLVLDEPETPVAVLAGISGARGKETHTIIARVLARRVPRVRRVMITTDVHAHLLANAGQRPAALVIAGTGSSVAVLDADETATIVGGRGPILGDDGSAYHLATTALRLAVRECDRTGEPPDILTALIRKAGLADENQLITWCAEAAKQEIAGFAETVVEHADTGDRLAKSCVTVCANSLAELVSNAIERTNLTRKAPIYFMGGMFEHSIVYCDTFRHALRGLQIENELLPTPFTGHRAVFQLVGLLNVPRLYDFVTRYELPIDFADSGESKVRTRRSAVSEPLDDLSTASLLDRMHYADAEALRSTQFCRTELATLVNRVAHAFRHGGRLIYVGAGTSGRIGVLDASECPPTFGVPPGQVIGIIAGGDRALRESIEGAEDDTDLGRADIDQVEPPIGKGDVVVGIAASGTTPYTLAAVAAAKVRGAATALVCCNPDVKAEVDHLIVLPTGPEVLPGSTRLKAGTATKMVLNAISTGAMALSGRVFEGYMIGVQPTNAKLRKRAAYIISELTGLSFDDATQRLADAGNSVAAAVIMERLKISAADAHALLERTRGDVRAAIALHASGKNA